MLMLLFGLQRSLDSGECWLSLSFNQDWVQEKWLNCCGVQGPHDWEVNNNFSVHFFSVNSDISFWRTLTFASSILKFPPFYNFLFPTSILFVSPSFSHIERSRKLPILAWTKRLSWIVFAPKGTVAHADCFREKTKALFGRLIAGKRYWTSLI